MDAVRTHPSENQELCLSLTRDEAYLLLAALQDPWIELGEHERRLCGKVRELWDLHRLLPREDGQAPLPEIRPVRSLAIG